MTEPETSAVTVCVIDTGMPSHGQVLIGNSIVSYDLASSARDASLPSRNPPIQIPSWSRVVASDLAPLFILRDQSWELS
jgi:hypothetical protein